MKFKLFLTALLLQGLFVINAQTITPIIDLHQNNSSGEPVLLDETVTVTGIVTVAAEFNKPYYVQDNTGGVAVYDNTVNQVAVGDSVTITAVVDAYNGLTELASVSNLDNHGFVRNIEPEVVTLADLSSMDCHGTELYEGNLIRINDVSISGTGNFEGDKNYDVSDASGTLEIRIDASTNITGTPIPGGELDIIGVVGQYSFSGCGGYQVFPRFIDDLVFAGGPIILQPVVASDITDSSFTVYFNTNEAGDSEIKFGLTEELELGSVIIQETTTEHIVPIIDLEPVTKYYFKAYSTNDGGTSESDLQTVITASDDPEVGKINVYFNYTVDHDVAIPGNEAMGGVDFPSKLIDRINRATHSIDIALYSFFGLDNIADAIVAAKNRGVKVRVVYDARNVQSSMQILLNAGIKMSQRPENMDGIMHNKFAIFDGRDTLLTNDWVWTGSWNWTSSELSWRNNIIEINDPSLSQAYTTEFEEMWGSDGDEPNSGNAKFGWQKTDNTVHEFNIRDREVKLFFSPSDNTENKIENTIATADTSIYFALLAFTSDPIGGQILNRQSAGVDDIRGIIDDANNQGSEFDRLDPVAEMFDYTLGGKLHHKYGIVDAASYWSNPYVITGSHNWSRSANEDNDENTLIIEDIYIANQYMQEFKKRYNELGGTTAFNVPVITSVKEKGLYPESIVLNQNYPNPFNPVTTITFFLPERKDVNLAVYSMLGEKVATLFKGSAPAGLNVVDFNAENIASGVYIYRLTTGNNVVSKKMVVLK